MNRCLSCLKEIIKVGYCRNCISKMYKGKTPVLNLNRKDFGKVRYRDIDHFSISGLQDKISLKLSGKNLLPATIGGEYILKPIPSLEIELYKADIPANEHLTMQIANQIFNIATAQNSLILFSDGELAYITKRFDRNKQEKIRQEDFCQLARISPETNGPNFKYELSYQQMGKIIEKFCAASFIEIEKLFKLILFNYVIGNGDAHLKNFSLIETENEDFVLAPAYDLINTNIHFPNENRLALDLFDDLETQHYQQNGFYGFEDFMQLSKIYRIKELRAQKIIDQFKINKKSVLDMIESSFLSRKAKSSYAELFLDRLKALTAN